MLQEDDDILSRSLEELGGDLVDSRLGRSLRREQIVRQDSQNLALPTRMTRMRSVAFADSVEERLLSPGSSTTHSRSASYSHAEEAGAGADRDVTYPTGPHLRRGSGLPTGSGRPGTPGRATAGRVQALASQGTHADIM